MKLLLLKGFFLALVLALPVAALAEEKTIEIGFFPNLTHAHALIAQNMAAEGKGWFESRLPGVTVNWHSFNAGPSAMEALFAKSVHLTYVGPNPVLNAYLRSKGGVRVISGAVRGGAGLLVPQDSPLVVPADFKGKRVATPQLGNTQDIACRFWLTQAGLTVTMTGGDVSIIPTPNPSILPLFTDGQVDAAWTVEPWLSRLETEANARLLYAEPAEISLTTVLSVSENFLKDEPQLTRDFAAAHHALSQWIIENPEEAQKRVAAELTRQMRREFPLELVRKAWPRLVFDDALSAVDFEFAFKAAKSAGFVKGEPEDIQDLVSAQ